MILTVLRDKTIIVWQLTRNNESYGYPKRVLTGHNHFVSDIVVSSDGQFALSSSWDQALRLWDLNTGATIRRFVGHTSDVLQLRYLGSLPGHKGRVTTIATSSKIPDMFLTASHDKTIIVWQLTRNDESYGYPKRVLTAITTSFLTSSSPLMVSSRSHPPRTTPSVFGTSTLARLPAVSSAILPTSFPSVSLLTTDKLSWLARPED